MQISPSILSADFANLEAELKRIGNAEWAHVDVMDAHFVPNLTLGLPVVESLLKVAPMPLDCHLMIDDPDRYVSSTQQLGLLDGAGEAVQQETVGGIVLAQSVTHHVGSHGGWNQLAGIHVLLRLLAQVGALGDVGAEKITGRDVRDLQGIGEQRGLGAFTCTGRA